MASTPSQRDIPLQPIPSVASGFAPSTHSRSTTNPFETASVIDTASTIGDTSTINRVLLPNTVFTPNTTLQIQAAGKYPISLPTPAKQLEIPIFSLTTGRPVYLSVRHSRRSGSCRLVDAEDEAGRAVASTTYTFGPYRNPVVRVGNIDAGNSEIDEFEMVGKSMVSRTVTMSSPKWGTFEWRYAGRKERADGVHNLLVLERIIVKENGERQITKVAQMVRSEETRTPGTKSSTAGNGGRLEMCLTTEDGGELVDEVTVVATCLVMLKKEIDRLRAIQIMMITSH